MSAGFTVDKGALNSRAGSVVVQLRDALEAVGRTSKWLDAHRPVVTDGVTGPDPLQTVPFSFSAEDVAQLRAAFRTLDDLRLVAYGQLTPQGANNYFWDAENLIGLN